MKQTKIAKDKRRLLFGGILSLALIAILLVLLIPRFTKSSVPWQSAPLAENAAQNSMAVYTLNFTYDEKLHTIGGTERIEVQNTSGEAWSELCINDWPSADEFLSAPCGDLTELTDCYITSNKGRYAVTPVRDTKNTCVIRIPLKEELQNGESLCMEANVLIHIPQGNDRFGFNDMSCNLGSFIPQLALRRAGGWVTHPYCEYGESMASECADFYLTLNAPKNLTVICTGESTTQNGITAAQANHVRDFCVVIGKEWHVAESRHGNVLVRSYYKGSFIMGKEALSAALDALDAYGSAIGAYPYTTLDIVETNIWAAGLEYPQLLMMNSSYYAWSFDLVHGYVHDNFKIKIAHEVAHQWFYGVVGNDQYDEAWIDEGFATHLEHIYADAVGLHHATAYTDQEYPLNTSLDILTQEAYEGVVYTCANGFLTDLVDIVGKEAFLSMLRKIYLSYGYSVVNTVEVLDIIRGLTPSSEKEQVEALIARCFNH